MEEELITSQLENTTGVEDELLHEEIYEENTSETMVEGETMETSSFVSVGYMDEVLIPKIDLYGTSIILVLGIIAGIISAGYIFKKV